MKWFYAIIIALILIASCLLGSITPIDNDEGVGFGVMGLIFAGIIIAAIRGACKEHSENAAGSGAVLNRSLPGKQTQALHAPEPGKYAVVQPHEHDDSLLHTQKKSTIPVYSDCTAACSHDDLMLREKPVA